MTLARIALGLAVMVAAGCGGGGGRSSVVHDVKFDVGGRVSYLLDPARPLSGVTITLTDVDGETKVATSASNGLWTASDLHPGPWIERLELAGYEPLERTFVLAIGGENDVANVFEGRPDAFLQETLLRVATSPFVVEIHDGQTFRDGYGYTMQYSVAAQGSIVLTLSRPVYYVDAELQDMETGQNVNASYDSVARTLTFAESDIDTLNGGNNGITTDTEPWTWHRIRIDGGAVTPLNGDDESFFATLFFNAVP